MYISKAKLAKAQKQFIGKTARVMGKYTGKVVNVYKANYGLVFDVECEHGNVMALEDETQIMVEREVVLGYTLSLEEILANTQPVKA